MTTEKSGFVIGPVQEKWLQALESGEYRQGLGSLCDESEGGMTFCCLGVFCETAGWERGRFSDLEGTIAHKYAIPGTTRKYVMHGTIYEGEGPAVIVSSLSNGASDRLGLHTEHGTALHSDGPDEGGVVRCTEETMKRISGKVPDFGRITDQYVAYFHEKDSIRLTTLNDKDIPFSQIAALVRAEPEWFFSKSV